MYRSSLSAALIAGISSPLWADVPAVATDIAPVHALVSQVMEGVGTPDLIVPPRSSPHGYAMRPSEARALSGADLVVWVGPLLTPWLADPLDSLAGSASHIALMEQPGTHVLPFREGAMFEAHDHRDEEQETHGDHDHAEQHDDNDVHKHDDSDVQKHDDSDAQKHDDSDAHESKVHDDHGHDDEVLSDLADEDDGHGHVDSGKDPHVWLDPRNGQLWLGQIAEALIKLDPENAAQYRENAETAQAALAALEDDIAETLAPVKDRPFIVFHDAYHYFEARFDIEALGAISENDARAPGAARVSELRGVVADSGAKCVFAEPQFNPGLIAAVTEGQGTGTGTLDPLGADLVPGAALYVDLLRGMAQNMADCLSD